MEDRVSPGVGGPPPGSKDRFRTKWKQCVERWPHLGPQDRDALEVYVDTWMDYWRWRQMIREGKPILDEEGNETAHSRKLASLRTELTKQQRDLSGPAARRAVPTKDPLLPQPVAARLLN